MFPVATMAQNDPEIDSHIICAGMHLAERFGNTWKQLKSDGLVISQKVPFFSAEDSSLNLAVDIGEGTKTFAQALNNISPDIVVVSGDRIENLALYSAATALRIPIAHMCGGDITEGAFDNQVRHAMTKLSHLHFVSMPEHAKRVIQMGEEPWRITLTGDAALDAVVALKTLPIEKVADNLGIAPKQPYFLTTFHPQTLGADNALEQYHTLLGVLRNVEETPVMIYPNIDPGFEPLVQLLEAFAKERPDVILRKNFERDVFYSLMQHATFIIGNSSSGIWEAPSFKLPAINLGDRQAKRIRAANVIQVTGLDTMEIQLAITKARSIEFKESLSDLRNPYGIGKAATRTLEVLKTVSLDQRLMTKKFYELEFDVKKLGFKAL